MLISGKVVLAAFGTTIALAASHGAAQAQYYKDKTLTLVVGFGTGGGVDIAARLYAEALSRTIPGQPTVIVNNMPGAGGARALNYITEAVEPDGLTVSFNAFNIATQLSGMEGVRYKYEDLTFIGGLRGGSPILTASTALFPDGYKEPADLMKAESLRYAGRDPTHSSDVPVALGLDMLGLKWTYIADYENPATIKVAGEQGEANITGWSLSTWLSDIKPGQVAEGTVVPIWQHPTYAPDGTTRKHELYGDVPSFEEVYRSIKGEDPSGPLWEGYKFYMEVAGTVNLAIFGPPNMNPEAAAALREGLALASKDAELLGKAGTVMGYSYAYVSPEEGEKGFDLVRSMTPEIAAFWKERIASFQH